MVNRRIPCAPESVEQTTLFRWAAYEACTRPELRLLYHVPNGGSRNKIEAARLRDQGVKPGVPDIHLPVARGGYHSLWIEMKREHGGTVRPEQTEWLAALTEQGHRVSVCRGWDDARILIENYLDGKEIRNDPHQ